MTDSQDDKAKTDRLMRYADGEADAAESIEMLRQMADDPDAARAAAHQQQLKDAVSRVMSGDTPATPEALRQRITRLAAETPAPGRVPGSAPGNDTGPIARIGFTQRWAPAIAAAVLIAVSLGVFFVASGMSPGRPHYQTIGGMHAASGIIAAQDLARYAGRHDVCAVNPDKLHGENFPAELERVPDAVLQHLHVQGAAAPGLDLSNWGYTFAGAGRCGIPGERSVHLVYRAIDNPDAPALSLWMCPDDGRFDIPESAVYRVIDQSAEHPMAVWRSAGIIYYLIGDNPDTVDRVAAGMSVKH